MVGRPYLEYEARDHGTWVDMKVWLDLGYENPQAATTGQKVHGAIHTLARGRFR